MHILAKHVPDQMKIAHGIKRFTGQRKQIFKCNTCMLLTNFIAVEKNNDDARRNYRSSNRLDGAKEIVLADARLETLRDYAREKRPYNKTNSDYWEKDIYEKRKRTE